MNRDTRSQRSLRAPNETAWLRTALSLASVGLIFGVGCRETSGPTPQTEPATNPTAAPAMASSSATALPSTTQTWRGDYKAEFLPLVVEPEKANEKAWKAESASAHTGAGSIEIQIEPNGRAHGTATGALGNATVSGQLDEDVLSLTVLPVNADDPAAISGTVALKKIDPSSLKGVLKASTGDSLTLRQAIVSLRKDP